MGLKFPFADALSVVVGLALGVGTGHLSAQTADGSTSPQGIGWPWILAAGVVVLVLACTAVVLARLASQKGRHR